MRGAARLFLTFTVLLSLLRCAAATVLWVRSYGGRVELLFPRSGGWGWVLLSENGTLALQSYGEVAPATGKASIATVVLPLIVIPHYAVVLVCAAGPIALLIRQQRRRMRHRGLPVVERETATPRDGS